MCTKCAYMWDGSVHDQVLDITPTFLISNLLSTWWQVDHFANQVSKAELRDIDNGVWHKINLFTYHNHYVTLNDSVSWKFFRSLFQHYTVTVGCRNMPVFTL